MSEAPHAFSGWNSLHPLIGSLKSPSKLAKNFVSVSALSLPSIAPTAHRSALR